MPIPGPRAFACSVAALLFFSQGIANPSHAKALECGSPNVLVEAASRSDTRHACRAADRAVRFLSSCGFTVPAIHIRIVTAMPENIPESALGMYSRSRNEILILAYPVFSERCRKSCLLNIPIDASVYRAVIAHEVAHAIALPNFRAPYTVLAQEYIGFVTFFHALKKSQREDILLQYDYDEHWMEYAAILYLRDPVEFGAHAYRHFHRPENGRRFFQEVLDGKVFNMDEGSD